MATKAVTVDTMDIGKKGGGKHWTAAQLEARQAAAEGMKRDGRVSLRCPDWLNDDAQKVWRKVVKQARGIDLYDHLDTDALAIYCDSTVKYRDLSRGEQTDDNIKALQSWARIIATYADKLGLTPQSRARLIKRRADELLGGGDDDDFDG